MKLLYYPLLWIVFGSLATCHASLMENLTDGKEHLNASPYGYTFVDLELPEEEWEEFASVDIQNIRNLHQFGRLEELPARLSRYITCIGANDQSLSDSVAHQMCQILQNVVSACDDETGWVFVRSTLPAPAFDIPRWHFDGNTYKVTEGENINIKFVLAIQGPQTLFYPLSPEAKLKLFRKTLDRNFMHQYCKADLVKAAPKGCAALFLGGRIGRAALHTEPPFQEKRLFMSIVPCNEKDIPSLKKRVLPIYPKDDDLTAPP